MPAIEFRPTFHAFLPNNFMFTCDRWMACFAINFPPSMFACQFRITQQTRRSSRLVNTSQLRPTLYAILFQYIMWAYRFWITNATNILSGQMRTSFVCTLILWTFLTYGLSHPMLTVTASGHSYAILSVAESNFATRRRRFAGCGSRFRRRLNHIRLAAYRSVCKSGGPIC
jgi:hypothetical protein